MPVLNLHRDSLFWGEPYDLGGSDQGTRVVTGDEMEMYVRELTEASTDKDHSIDSRRAHYAGLLDTPGAQVPAQYAQCRVQTHYPVANATRRIMFEEGDMSKFLMMRTKYHDVTPNPAQLHAHVHPVVAKRGPGERAAQPRTHTVLSCIHPNHGDSEIDTDCLYMQGNEPKAYPEGTWDLFVTMKNHAIAPSEDIIACPLLVHPSAMELPLPVFDLATYAQELSSLKVGDAVTLHTLYGRADDAQDAQDTECTVTKIEQGDVPMVTVSSKSGDPLFISPSMPAEQEWVVQPNNPWLCMISRHGATKTTPRMIFSDPPSRIVRGAEPSAFPMTDLLLVSLQASGTWSTIDHVYAHLVRHGVDVTGCTTREKVHAFVRTYQGRQPVRAATTIYAHTHTHAAAPAAPPDPELLDAGGATQVVRTVQSNIKSMRQTLVEYIRESPVALVPAIENEYLGPRFFDAIHKVLQSAEHVHIPGNQVETALYSWKAKGLDKPPPKNVPFDIAVRTMARMLHEMHLVALAYEGLDADAATSVTAAASPPDCPTVPCAPWIPHRYVDEHMSDVLYQGKDDSALPLKLVTDPLASTAPLTGIEPAAGAAANEQTLQEWAKDYQPWFDDVIRQADTLFSIAFDSDHAAAAKTLVLGVKDVVEGVVAKAKKNAGTAGTKELFTNVLCSFVAVMYPRGFLPETGNAAYKQPLLDADVPWMVERIAVLHPRTAKVNTGNILRKLQISIVNTFPVFRTQAAADATALSHTTSQWALFLPSRADVGIEDASPPGVPHMLHDIDRALGNGNTVAYLSNRFHYYDSIDSAPVRDYLRRVKARANTQRKAGAALGGAVKVRRALPTNIPVEASTITVASHKPLSMAGAAVPDVDAPPHPGFAQLYDTAMKPNKIAAYEALSETNMELLDELLSAFAARGVGLQEATVQDVTRLCTLGETDTDATPSVVVKTLCLQLQQMVGTFQRAYSGFVEDARIVHDKKHIPAKERDALVRMFHLDNDDDTVEEPLRDAVDALVEHVRAFLPQRMHALMLHQGMLPHLAIMLVCYAMLTISTEHVKRFETKAIYASQSCLEHVATAVRDANANMTSIRAKMTALRESDKQRMINELDLLNENKEQKDMVQMLRTHGLDSTFDLADNANEEIHGGDEQNELDYASYEGEDGDGDEY